ncbi:MAG: hypothetical protein WD048_16190 [Chitinophagales bacterium]
MLRQDKIGVGLLYGFLFPVLLFVLIRELNLFLVELDFGWVESAFGINPRFLTEFQVRGGFSDKFIAILAVCCNLIPFNVFKKAGKDHALQGVLTATFVLVIVLVIFFWDDFLGN